MASGYFRFQCQKCGTCCKENIVFCLEIELKRISRLLSKPISVMRKEYATQVGEMTYELKKKPDGFCIFHSRGFNSASMCAVYLHAPLSCRMWPVAMDRSSGKYQVVDKPELKCPGIGKGKRYTIASWFAELRRLDELLSKSRA